MRKTITLLLVLMSLNSYSQLLKEQDKQMHVTVSFMMQTSLNQIDIGYGKAAAISLGVGIAKECLDIKTTGFDKRDLQADIIGIATSIAFDIGIKKIFKAKPVHFWKKKRKIKCYL